MKRFNHPPVAYLVDAVVRVGGGKLQPVEVSQKLLDLVRAIDVGHGVDPVAGGGAGDRDIGVDAEAAETAPAQAGRPPQRADLRPLRQRARHPLSSMQKHRWLVA